MEHILLVEDDRAIVMGLTYSLEQEGYQVTVQEDCPSTLKVLEEQTFDLCLLDLTLPGGSGYDVCRRVKELGDTPVIFLTAMDDEVNVVMGLDMGADDYITKPFSVSELIARLEALTRRIHRGTGAAKPAEEPEQLVSGPFVLDEKSRILYKSGTPIDLTQVEFQIMELFFRNPATALVREKILVLFFLHMLSALF